MKSLDICIHKGGHVCRNHGGSGSAFHEGGYVHPFLNGAELAGRNELTKAQLFESVGQQRDVEIAALESEFDDSAAISMLGISLNKGVSRAIQDKDLLLKSFFDFDLVTEEGLVKFLNLLPVIDFEIIKEVMESIWPAYPTEGINSATARMELKGFLLDYIDQLSEEDSLGSGSDDPE